ncbi:hypothetical protein ANN_15763 [Periplaneta americana]|uniref:Uncharacterized protein n=1 Tax=Periplaneta americana TaxID=6978 RepID=A0ABQ8SI48_PERAM|nr:hypothetical protein ANN_15763 [Periplaneta americana]
MVKVCQRKMERKIMQVTLKDRIRNVDLRKNTCMKDAVQVADELKWNWGGHVAGCVFTIQVQQMNVLAMKNIPFHHLLDFPPHGSRHWRLSHSSVNDSRCNTKQNSLETKLAAFSDLDRRLKQREAKYGFAHSTLVTFMKKRKEGQCLWCGRNGNGTEVGSDGSCGDSGSNDYNDSNGSYDDNVGTGSGGNNGDYVINGYSGNSDGVRSDGNCGVLVLLMILLVDMVVMMVVVARNGCNGRSSNVSSSSDNGGDGAGIVVMVAILSMVVVVMVP